MGTAPLEGAKLAAGRSQDDEVGVAGGERVGALP